ncbi:phospholipid-transporting ATPase IG-like [Ceratina calcarata]|uniref:Phospholipid-transporting ATPase IG-like n=1 Tax=Ceratina calcarata TaxID=156304 RepID=A0AAJ7W9P7_9HYME|nr:phospholipid-transporting ATPase IG-like [Ceratina calcarata]
MEALITCQHPSSDLYSFHGKIEIKNTIQHGVSGHLTTHNLLLRGSRLKDTDYIVGCAVYTGHDSKLSLNSKIRSTKFSTVEKSINKQILLFITILTFEVIFSCIMKNVFQSTYKLPYLGPEESINVGSVILDFLNFTVLYNYTVPISLYVTIGKSISILMNKLSLQLIDCRFST